jgi:hypothetical protein
MIGRLLSAVVAFYMKIDKKAFFKVLNISQTLEMLMSLSLISISCCIIRIFSHPKNTGYVGCARKKEDIIVSRSFKDGFYTNKVNLWLLSGYGSPQFLRVYDYVDSVTVEIPESKFASLCLSLG